MKLLTFSFLILLHLTSLAKEKLVVAVSNFEPWTIVTSDSVTGIDMQLIDRLAAMQNLDVVHFKCPWVRCLQLLKVGQIDIVSNIFHSEERAEYLSYFKSPYIHGNNRIFYINNSGNIKIESPNDLTSLRVGLRRGVKYFNDFDKNNKLDKVYVNHNTQLINMLLKFRLDTFIGQEDVVDYLLLKKGLSKQIGKATYKHFQVDKGYLAFSKLSKLLHLKPEMENNLRQLIEDKTIIKIKEQYR